MSTLEQIAPEIIGAQLAIARKARGLTQQAVADALGVARTTVTALEKGIRRPRPSEFVQLAQLYGVSVGDLARAVVRDAATVSTPFIELFRHVRPTGGEVVDQRWKADLHEFEALCGDYVEIERLADAPLPRRYLDYDISGSDVEIAAVEVALSEGNRLGLGDGPVGDVRSILESDVGMRVFALDFRAERLAGFLVYAEELGGCVALNARHPEWRRRWTAAQAYGCFLTNRYRPERIMLTDGRNMPKHERFAFAFARQFLIPAAGLIRRFQAMNRSKRGHATSSDAVAISDQYGVSIEALVLRLEELRLVPSGAWERLKTSGIARDDDCESVQPRWSGERPVLLPRRFETLAVQAFESGLISEGRLAEFLRTDRLDARRRVETLTHREYVAEGNVRPLRLDLSTELAAGWRR